jgi:hypothetical protein
MQIPSDLLRCVGFVAMELADGSKRLVGTAFFVGTLAPEGTGAFHYVVTARHVIDGIRNMGLDKVFLRVNLQNAEARWLEYSVRDWMYHPTDPSVDVAVARGAPDHSHDHVSYPVTDIKPLDAFSDGEVSLGDEVFILGLFVRHFGTFRNVPIVRIGTIAATPDERIETRFGPMRAFLIEARSIGGLSGSPVFANQGTLRARDSRIQIRKDPLVNLIGLMHGHYDEKSVSLAASSGDAEEARINMGIGVVVPAAMVLEVLRQPAVLEMEERAWASARPDQPSTPSSA